MKWEFEKAKFLCQQHSNRKALRKNPGLRGGSNFSGTNAFI